MHQSTYSKKPSGNKEKKCSKKIKKEKESLSRPLNKHLKCKKRNKTLETYQKLKPSQ